MLGLAASADDASEAMGKEATAEEAVEFFVDVAGEAAAVGAGGDQLLAESVKLGSDHAVEDS